MASQTSPVVRQPGYDVDGETSFAVFVNDQTLVSQDYDVPPERSGMSGEGKSRAWW